MQHNISQDASRVFWTKDDIRNKIEKSKVVVFAKGNQEHPRCGFSERVFKTITDCGKPYEVVDVCEDKSIVPALRAFAGNLSLPAVYVNGDLISTSETLQHMVDTGELKEKVEAAFK